MMVDIFLVKVCVLAFCRTSLCCFSLYVFVGVGNSSKLWKTRFFQQDIANSHGRHNDSFLNLLPCAHFKSMDLIQLSSTHPVATAAAALVMAGASTMFYYFVIEPATSPLNALPGPP
ncbi:hypothetical protein Ae201684_018197 [Aphanomyces euteiches]|uniref:Uncharacterized protein n=1 Tax=Aphanomyces euteiches TaxID=100861 RepID=A0A6G0W6L5_9STRA|nr:hypothetical protein Ae201684_018197 [Aphanomyces euteiches]